MVLLAWVTGSFVTRGVSDGVTLAMGTCRTDILSNTAERHFLDHSLEQVVLGCDDHSMGSGPALSPACGRGSRSIVREVTFRK